MLDRVTDRREIRDELIVICRMLMKQTPPTWGDLPAPGPEDMAQGADTDQADKAKKK